MSVIFSMMWLSLLHAYLKFVCSFVCFLANDDSRYYDETFGFKGFRMSFLRVLVMWAFEISVDFICHCYCLLESLLIHSFSGLAREYW